MAKKITELTELTSVATGDLFIVEDVSTSTTKKITWDNLVEDASITTAKINDGAVTAPKITFDGALVYNNTATQTLSNATFAAITFDDEIYDTNTYHDTSTNKSRLTVPRTGYYRVTATLGFAANTTGVRILTFRVNGSTGDRFGYQMNSAAGSTALVMEVTTTTVLKLTAADYVEVFAYQNSGGNLATAADGGSGSARFMIDWLGA